MRDPLDSRRSRPGIGIILLWTGAFAVLAAIIAIVALGEHARHSITTHPRSPAPATTASGPAAPSDSDRFG